MGAGLTKDRASYGINISKDLRNYFVFPAGGFLTFPNTNGYAEYTDKRPPPHKPLEYPEPSTWRFDCSGYGTEFQFVPLELLPMSPMRIAVTLPDQVQWPSSLWHLMDARDSVHVNRDRAKGLGITRHLQHALTAWSKRVPDFEQLYRRIPFGSMIRVRELKIDVEEIHFEIVPNTKLDNHLLSGAQLAHFWNTPQSEMPPEVAIDQLVLDRYLADGVCLVYYANKLMAFKSRVNNIPYMYHEIKVLMTIPPCDQIIGPPKFLVTLTQVGSHAGGVCGYLMEYLDGGTLSHRLPELKHAEKLTLSQSLDWSLDLVSALLQIIAIPGQFYSDLRMDQLALRNEDDGSQTAVLIDFEQDRNFWNWVAPEIYYLEWIAELSDKSVMRKKDLDEKLVRDFSTLLNRYLTSRRYPLPLQGSGDDYNNPEMGWYYPYLSSRVEERESAMVFMLGKALWCLFEGCGDCDIILGKSNPWEAEQRFPEFRRTPPEIRDLIKSCTAGAREWDDGHVSIYRRGGQIFPLGKTGLNGEPLGTTAETKKAITTFWQKELDKAEVFYEARIRYDAGNASEADIKLLHFLRRPTIQFVYQTLQDFQMQAEP